MKKTIYAFLCFSVFFFSFSYATNTETLEAVMEQTEEYYNLRSGPQDATFRTVGKSMWAWGIGLSAAIAILASAIHQSAAPSDSE